MGSVTKTASEKNGTWTFPGCDLGTWTVKAVLGIKAAEEKVVIAEDGHLFTYYVSLYFQLYPSDFDLSAYGTKGVDYEVVQDNDTVIPAADYQKYDNWKVRLLTSGKKTITAKKRGNIDLFVVGAGAGNYYTGSNYVWRGTGGDVKTLLKFPVDAGDAYPVVIGAGGIGGAVGGNTSGFGVTANGGYAELTYKAPYFAGVYEFGAPSGTKLYGGNYPDDVKKDGEPNTGFGSCNGGKKSDKGNNGGSGIIIFRNARG